MNPDQTGSHPGPRPLEARPVHRRGDGRHPPFNLLVLQIFGRVLHSFTLPGSVATLVTCLSVLCASFALSASASEPKSTKTLNIALPSRPVHLNSALLSGTYTGTPASQLFATLLRADRKWKLHPYLAESWRTAADGLSLRFELRQGAKFHDGAPITSADVAFSIETVKRYHPFNNMLSAVTSVETPTPHTAILQLSRPSAVLELVTASPMLPILPKHIYGDGQPIRTHPANWKVVGSGPFRLDRVTDDSLVMKKFEGFFIKGRPLLDELVFNVVDDRTIQIAFETGRVQLQGFNSDVRVTDDLEKRPNVNVDRSGYGGVGATRVLIFNLLRPPFDNPSVRHAIALTIDKKSIAKAVFLNKATPIRSAIHPDAPYYYDVPGSNRYDPDEANRLLDAAGFARDNRGIRFSATFDTGSDPGAAYYLETAQYIRRDLLDKLGISLRLIYNREFKEYVTRLSNWDYDIAFINYFNWGDPSIGVHRMFDSKNIRKGVMFSNLTSYSNPSIDALMEKADRTIDPVARKEVYKELQIKLAHDLPVFPLISLPFSTIYASDLMGLDNSIWGLMFPFDELHWKHDKQ